MIERRNLWRPVGKLVQQSFGEVQRVKRSKPTQSKPKPIWDRSGKPEDSEHVFVDKGKTSRSQEIDDKSLQEELDPSDRTGKLVKCDDNRVMQVHDRTEKPVESSTHTHSARSCSNIVILHHRTRTSSTLQSMRRTSTSTSQACRTR